MKCPRCVQMVTPAVSCCPHCGFSLNSACTLYGSEAVVAQRLMDIEGVLDLEKRERVLSDLAAFDLRFPQLFFLVYLGPLPPPASPRQFAFWLLNHAAVEGADAFHPNERGLLLVIDPRGGNAVLAGGYFIENFVTQEELDTILKGASHELGLADYPAALRAITQTLGTLLKRKAIAAAKHPKRFQTELPKAPGHGVFPSLVRTGESAPGFGGLGQLSQRELLLERATASSAEPKPKQKKRPAENPADPDDPASREKSITGEAPSGDDTLTSPVKGTGSSSTPAGTKRLTPRRRR